MSDICRECAQILDDHGLLQPTSNWDQVKKNISELIDRFQPTQQPAPTIEEVLLLPQLNNCRMKMTKDTCGNLEKLKQILQTVSIPIPETPIEEIRPGEEMIETTVIGEKEEEEEIKQPSKKRTRLEIEQAVDVIKEKYEREKKRRKIEKEKEKKEQLALEAQEQQEKNKQRLLQVMDTLRTSAFLENEKIDDLSLFTVAKQLVFDLDASDELLKYIFPFTTVDGEVQFIQDIRSINHEKERALCTGKSLPEYQKIMEKGNPRNFLRFQKKWAQINPFSGVLSFTQQDVALAQLRPTVLFHDLVSWRDKDTTKLFDYAEFAAAGDELAARLATGAYVAVVPESLLQRWYEKTYQEGDLYLLPFMDQGRRNAILVYQRDGGRFTDRQGNALPEGVNYLYQDAFPVQAYTALEMTSTNPNMPQKIYASVVNGMPGAESAAPGTIELPFYLYDKVVNRQKFFEAKVPDPVCVRPVILPIAVSMSYELLSQDLQPEEDPKAIKDFDKQLQDVLQGILSNARLLMQGQIINIPRTEKDPNTNTYVHKLIPIRITEIYAYTKRPEDEVFKIARVGVANISEQDIPVEAKLSETAYETSREALENEYFKEQLLIGWPEEMDEAALLQKFSQIAEKPKRIFTQMPKAENTMLFSVRQIEPQEKKELKKLGENLDFLDITTELKDYDPGVHAKKGLHLGIDPRSKKIFRYHPEQDLWYDVAQSISQPINTEQLTEEIVTSNETFFFVGEQRQQIPITGVSIAKDLMEVEKEKVKEEQDIEGNPLVPIEERTAQEQKILPFTTDAVIEALAPYRYKPTYVKQQIHVWWTAFSEGDWDTIPKETRDLLEAAFFAATYTDKATLQNLLKSIKENPIYEKLKADQKTNYNIDLDQVVTTDKIITTLAKWFYLIVFGLNPPQENGLSPEEILILNQYNQDIYSKKKVETNLVVADEKTIQDTITKITRLSPQ